MDGSMSRASTEALVTLARCVLNSGASGGPERLIDAALLVIEHAAADALASALMSEGEVTATDEARELVELSDEVSERVERDRRPTVRVAGAERRGEVRVLLPRSDLPEDAIRVLEHRLPELRRWAERDVPSLWYPAARRGNLSWLQLQVQTAPPDLLSADELGGVGVVTEALTRLVSAAGVSAQVLEHAQRVEWREAASLAIYRAGPVERIVSHGIQVGGLVWREARSERLSPPVAPLLTLCATLDAVMNACASTAPDEVASISAFCVGVRQGPSGAAAESLWRGVTDLVRSALRALDRTLCDARVPGLAARLQDQLQALRDWWRSVEGLPPWSTQVRHPGTYLLSELRQLAPSPHLELVMEYALDGPLVSEGLAFDARRGPGDKLVVRGRRDDPPPYLLDLVAWLGDAVLVQALPAPLVERARALLAHPLEQHATEMRRTKEDCADALLNRLLELVGERSWLLAEMLTDKYFDLKIICLAQPSEVEATRDPIPVPFRVAGGRAVRSITGRGVRLILPQVRPIALDLGRVGGLASGCPGGVSAPWAGLWASCVTRLTAASQALMNADRVEGLVDSGGEALAALWALKLTHFAWRRDWERTHLSAEYAQIMDVDRQVRDLLFANGVGVTDRASVGGNTRVARPLLERPPAWFDLLWRAALDASPPAPPLWAPEPPRVVWPSAAMGAAVPASLVSARLIGAPPHQPVAEVVRSLVAAAPPEDRGTLDPFLGIVGMALEPRHPPGDGLPARVNGQAGAGWFAEWEHIVEPGPTLGLSWREGVRKRDGDRSWIVPPMVRWEGGDPAMLERLFPAPGLQSPLPLALFGVPRSPRALAQLVGPTWRGGDQMARAVFMSVVASAWWPDQIHAVFRERASVELMERNKSEVVNYPVARPVFELLATALRRLDGALGEVPVAVRIGADQVDIATRLYMADPSGPGEARAGLLRVLIA